jgi:nuclease S1
MDRKKELKKRKGRNMKTQVVFLFILFLFLVSSNYPQERISARDAGKYIGKTVTVVDSVNQVYKSKNGDYFLDMGGDYPDNAFTAIIFNSDASKIDSVESYEGKIVEITGKVKEYQGKAEIIVNKKEQIKMEQ